MRDRDRWWWLLVLAGIACGIAGIVVPYHLVTNELTPAENQFVTDADYRQWIGIDIFLGLVILSCAVTLIIMAVRAHRRHLLRLAAFAGDMDVMPLAEIRTNTANATDVVAQPLELLWRRSKATGTYYILGISLSGVLGLVSILGFIYTLLAPIFAPLQSTLTDPLDIMPPQPISGLEIAFRFAGATTAVGMLVALVILLIRLFPFLHGRPFGVTATDQGLDTQTEFGTRIHINWEEARLLEAMGTDASAARRYSLYAPGKCISWAAYKTRFGADCVLVDISASEMTLRQAALLNLIVARTGLPPRTLVKSLQKGSASSGELKRSTSVILLLACAVVLAGIAVVAYLIPVAPIAWLRWVSTGALTLAVLNILVSALRVALIKRISLAHTTPPSVGAPTFDAPGIVYVLNWRPPLSRCLRLIVVGLALAVNLIPAELLLLVAFGVALPGSHLQNLYGNGGDFTLLGRLGMVMVHGLLGFIGAGLAYTSTPAATERIRADQRGLTTEHGRRQQMIAWSNIQYILWGTWGGQFHYWVMSNVPTIWTSWPAGSQAANLIPLDGGALPIGADELAALVAAQIGKPVRVRLGR